ncbi:hypothetical protein [Bacillus sp. AG4(2022)]|uniref:hypothetical protein n=1 Tax=Bacillus sp. AG4(2022) TaxID=2962594 RepID=UPI002881180E|nr:hypothetical protein [Bacillus sp. AG4(2022)]MDT0163812.1 hypothetical protein [Bacillus sp. AG4(2022)]
MGLDFIMEYEKAKQQVKEDGWDSFLESFQEKHPSYDLYSVSTPWFDDSSYICKFRGGGGDIVVGWKGVHDND